MRKKYLVLIIVSCLLGVGNFVFAQGTWTATANFPGVGVDYPFCFNIGNKGYIGTGDGNSGTTKQFWEFNPAGGVWTQKADFGGSARWAATGFAIGDKGYAGLGYGGSRDLWQYDTTANTWTQKAAFPGGAQNVAMGFAIGNYGYIAGGWNIGPVNELWQYDPGTDTWTQKANMPVINSDASSFVIGTDGYIVCGYDGGATVYPYLFQYNSLTDTWTQKASCPGAARADNSAFSICGKGYMGFGEGPIGVFLADFWQYDPLSNSWTQKANLPAAARDEGGCFAIGNKGYFGLGRSSGSTYFNDFFEYTPDSACAQCIPAANFSSSDSVFCSEPLTCIDFTDLSTCNATSWRWVFQGAVPDTSTQQNPTQICYGSPGTYAVTLVVSNAAGSDSITVASMIIVGSPPSPPTITIIGGDTLISSHGMAYQWFLNGNVITGATDSFYVAQQIGTYSVRITDAFGCSSISPGIPLEIMDINGSDNFSIFPNPFSSSLDVIVRRNGEYEISMFDVTSRRLLNFSFKNLTSINTEMLASGIYIFELSNINGFVERGRLIKQ